MPQITILCLGDIVGRPARDAIRTKLPALRSRYGLDAVIANGENAAGGVGVDAQVAHELHDMGIDVITLGDHTWHRKTAKELLVEHSKWIIRPANFPPAAPGRGWTILESAAAGWKIGVINLLGRVFMNSPLDCPFRAASEILASELNGCAIVVVDMHAEATSEKGALAHYLDGRVSLVVGTHTHVQTADECILSGGTGFITDLGMCGPQQSVIGMDADAAVNRFISGVGIPYDIAKAGAVLQGIIAQIDCQSGKTLELERLKVLSSE